MLNLKKLVCNPCNKICDLNHSFVHNGKKKWHQEVEIGYTFVNIFVKLYLTI